MAMPSQLVLQPNVTHAEIQFAMLRNLLGTFVDKIDHLGDKVRILSMPSARKRIAFHLFSVQEKSGSIRLHLTREEMADYLGMARPSLSRELGRMQEEGIIQVKGPNILILNQALFEELLDATIFPENPNIMEARAPGTRSLK